MSYIILTDTECPVMFPIECKEDIVNIRIPTSIKPSVQEVITLIARQKEEMLSIENKIKNKANLVADKT